MANKIFVPTLHTFAMKNPFTGSCGLFRYKVVPNVVMATAKEVDFYQSTMEAKYWHGLYCYEKSQVEGEKVFPLTDAGRQEMMEWLEANI